MKKLLIFTICIGLVGCTTKEAEPQESATPTPTPEETSTAYFESKINIDLYKADEYYPIVDGVVTYPDGTTEEFSNGETVPKLDGTGEDAYYLYEMEYGEEVLSTVETKEDSVVKGYYHYTVNIGNHIICAVSNELSDEYVLSESSLNNDGIVDGVFGLEFVTKDERKPYVIYRYSNYVPKGEDINNAFRLIVGENAYYVWRIKDYDDLEGFDEINKTIGRVSALMWGGYDGDSYNPHVFSFIDGE